MAKGVIIQNLTFVGENDLDAGYIMLNHDVLIYEFLERLGILLGLCYFNFE